MTKCNSKDGDTVKKDKLICAGLWTGTSNIDKDIQAGRVSVSIYSSSCDGGKGGDIYFFGVCRDNTLTRLAIADVVGHGQAVSDVSHSMEKALRANMCNLNSNTILFAINQIARHCGLKALTTAAVITYDASKGECRISYAGHPPVLFNRAGSSTWSFTSLNDRKNKNNNDYSNLPLALTLDTKYDELLIPANLGDRIFVYTDGVTEARDTARQFFGSERLKEVLEKHADSTLSQLKAAVVRALQKYTDKKLNHDDVTLIVMEILKK